MIKSTAKALIHQIVPRLPWGAREALFEALCRHMGDASVAARVIPRLGKLGLYAEGEFGHIQSAPNDAVVLPVYARSGTYARRSADLLRSFFAQRGGGTYIDVGGNIGLTTIPIARDPAVHCLVFEPEPVNHGHLLANLRRNCVNDNVVAHQVALFDKRATIKFSIATENLGDHRISLGAEHERATIDVEARPLDDYLDQVRGALAIKIDTQGAEPYVIAGGPRLLAQASLVILEFSPWLMKVMGTDPAVVLNFLSGFPRLALGSPEGDQFSALQSFSEVSPQLAEVLQRGANDGHHYVDVLAVRD
jgi:FkbM family methyltransferase